MPAFFFNDTATTEIYTLSLHDALPISLIDAERSCVSAGAHATIRPPRARSEEHTSELQSRENLVCRLLLEKKNTIGPALSADERFGNDRDAAGPANARDAARDVSGAAR